MDNRINTQITFLILFLMTLAQIGTDVYLPSFPAIKMTLLTTTALVQLTFSVFLAGFAVSQLIYGPLSDRFGRKPFLLIGVSLYFLTSIIAATTSSIYVLLIARTIQGMGAGACSVIPRAIMQDHFSGKELERINIYQSMSWSLVPIFAPLIGSYIQQYLGWRFNFIFLAIISLSALILIIMFKESIKEREASLTIRQVITHYRKVVFHNQFFANLVCAISIVSILAAFNVSAPILIQETLHLSSLQYGWSIFTVGMSFLIGALLNRFLITQGWLGNYIASIGIGLVTIAALTLVTCAVFKNFNVWMLLFPIMIMQVGSALIFPNNSTKALKYFPNIAGKAAAVFGCSLFLGSTITSGIISVLPTKSLMPLSLVILTITGIMLAAHLKILAHESLLSQGEDNV